MEHRDCRSRSHLLSRRQQDLCLRYSRWSTHSDANANGHTVSNTYAVSYCDSNLNATCYSNTNSDTASNTYADTYCDSNVNAACYSNSDSDTAGNTYTDSYCDSNVNATCYSDTNSYAYTDSKSLAKCESNVDSQGNPQASPDAATAPDSPSSATVIGEW